MKLNSKRLMAENKTFFKLFVILTMLYLAFQVKPWGSVSGAIFSGDDHSYYGYVSSFVNDLDLDFSNNQLSGHSGLSPVTGKIVVGHPIGTSILLAPFYVIAKPIVWIVNKLTSEPYNQKHLIFFMFMCSGMIVYLYLGSYLLFEAISLSGINRRISILSVALSIWGTILPAYAFRRPILTHIPEFFLIALLLYLTIKWKNADISFRRFFVLALVSGGVIITRWNNIHILCFILYWLFMHKNYFSGILKRKIIAFMIFPVIIFLIFFLTQSLAWKYFYGSYFTLFPLNKGATFAEILSLQGLKNLFHIFIGLDWGLLYTMFPFVVGLFAFLWLNPLKISKRKVLERIFYIMLFSFPFVIVLRWQRQADYYGYRYLLSLLPFTCIGISFLFDRILKKFPGLDRLLVLFTIIVLASTFLLMLPFEYTQPTNLERGTSLMGGNGYINNSYLANASKFYFTSSPKTLGGSFTRGFLGAYVFGSIYLLSPDFFTKISGMNTKIQQYYALDSFDKIIVLIYPLLVFLMLLAVYKWCSNGRQRKS